MTSNDHLQLPSKFFSSIKPLDVKRKKVFALTRNRACETGAGKAGGFASSRLWAVTRRCFDIDLRIGQRRLSILMARDRDSARCEAHVLLMILVYRGIPSPTIYSHRRARIVEPRIVSALPGRGVICPGESRGWATRTGAGGGRVSRGSPGRSCGILNGEGPPR